MKRIGRYLLRGASVFFYFVAYLQLTDHFIRYGIFSVLIGSALISPTVIAAVRKRRDAGKFS